MAVQFFVVTQDILYHPWIALVPLVSFMVSIIALKIIYSGVEDSRILKY